MLNVLIYFCSFKFSTLNFVLECSSLSMIFNNKVQVRKVKDIFFYHIYIISKKLVMLIPVRKLTSLMDFVWVGGYLHQKGRGVDNLWHLLFTWRIIERWEKGKDNWLWTNLFDIVMLFFKFTNFGEKQAYLFFNVYLRLRFSVFIYWDSDFFFFCHFQMAECSVSYFSADNWFPQFSLYVFRSFKILKQSTFFQKKI